MLSQTERRPDGFLSVHDMALGLECLKTEPEWPVVLLGYAKHDVVGLNISVLANEPGDGAHETLANNPAGGTGTKEATHHFGVCCIFRTISLSEAMTNTKLPQV